MGLVNDFGQFWYLTITPYEKDIEPGVPDKSEAIEAFKHLSRVVGAEACGWGFENTKYDTIYSYMKYTNGASYSTALANGMKKVKEYPDLKMKFLTPMQLPVRSGKSYKISITLIFFLTWIRPY